MKWYAKLALTVAAAAVIPACSDSSDSGGGGGAGGVSGCSFTARGGTGSVDGGSGGSFEAYAYGQDCKVLSSGEVNSEVRLPAVTVPYLGTNPADITVDTTWNVGGELALASTTVTSGGTVTGVHVRPGVTLTIQPNYDQDPADGTLRDTVRVNFNDGIYVEGTIRIDYRDSAAAGDSLSNDCSRFFPSAANLVVAEGGRILVNGKDVAGGTGGNGGYFSDISVWGTVVNRGTITTVGGNGNTGGNGGTLYFGEGSQYGCYNTGTITSAGGTGATGNGGNGGALYMSADDGYGPLMNSGTVSSRGGDGFTGGGDGGDMSDWYTYYGAFVNSGTITSAGGNATDAASNGSGGDGGDFYMYTCGGVRATGTINTSGGNGAGTTGDGGSGGYVEIYSDYDYDWGYGYSTTMGLYFGANVNTNGGNGEYGGDAGYTYFEIYTSDYQMPGQQPLCLVGYSTIDLRGGDGGDDGGSGGGNNYLYSDYGYDETSTYYVGSVIVSSNIDARGGNGGTGSGGGGGYIELWTYESIYATQGADYGVRVSGNLSTSGGNGTVGGSAGGVWMYGRFIAEVSGNIDSNGGSGTTGNGGSSSDIEIYSSYDVKQTGALNANGGASASANGQGGANIYVAGLFVTAGGSYNAKGGNGGTGAGDVGGDGGYVEIVSQENSTAWSGSVSVTGGTGTTAGDDGDFWLDGIHVSGE